MLDIMHRDERGKGEIAAPVFDPTQIVPVAKNENDAR